ncbi:MAG TPA: hypothetical protein VM599_00185 [Thermoanaerobaculia bacterium]|nr:hypothetical protein [Thermoanaerobaculia bacterium]
MERKVFFVKYWDKGSTSIGADQMAPALERLGVDARVIYAESLSAVRDALLVFIKRADLRHLIEAGARGNRRVLDVQDTVVFRRWISHWMFYDGVIFRNRRQLQDFAPRGALSRTISQHWDPRYQPHRAGADRLRVAYLGIPRSLDLWGRIPEVEFLGPSHWFEGAREFNAHLSVRHSHREWLYKPNAKVATAAACEAVLITTPDCASVELLGEDYPFYLAGSDAESIRTGLDFARSRFGGPEWHEALARLRALKPALSLDRVAAQYLEMLRELDFERPARRVPAAPRALLGRGRRAG